MKDNSGQEQKGLTDKDFSEAHFDDKLFLFFNKYKNLLTNLVIVAMLCVIAYQGVKFYGQYKEKQVQQAYLEAVENNTLEAFAKDHASDGLGGVAYLSLGDKAYEEKKYNEAATYYLYALDGLRDSVLNGRAQLGRAMSLMQADQPGVAEALKSLANSEQTLKTIRFEALTNLCIFNAKKQQYDAFKTNLDQLRTIAGTFGMPWVMRVENFAAAIPELANN